MGDRKKSTSEMFRKFWKVYPKKSDKTDTEKLFNKLILTVQEMIIDDVVKRKDRHYQWQDKGFIPSPARYIRKKLWNDEIVERKTIIEHQLENEDGSILSRFWIMLLQIYGKRLSNNFGDIMPIAWHHGLFGITEKECSRVLKYLVDNNDNKLLDLPRVIQIRRMVRREPIQQVTPPPHHDPKVIDNVFREVYKILKQGVRY